MILDDVLFDWGLAEMISPVWSQCWSGPSWDALRQALKTGGADSLSPEARVRVVAQIKGVRAPILGEYGPRGDWVCRCIKVSTEELAEFRIIRHQGQPPTVTLGQFSEKVRQSPQGGEVTMRNIILEILANEGGTNFTGTAVAVLDGESRPPILVEGYKRCMAALWDENRREVDVHLCSPPAVGARA